MAEYEVLGGKKIRGNTTLEILEAVRRIAFNPESDLEAYLKTFAAHCQRYSSMRIRTDSPENALKDIIKYGFIRKVKD